jgi:type III secretory pathway component EscR
MKKIKNIAILLIAFILSVNITIASVAYNTLGAEKKDKNSARSVNKHARKNYRNQLKKKKHRKFSPTKQKPKRNYRRNGCDFF